MRNRNGEKLGKLWAWAKAAFYYVVVIALLLMIYVQVIQTRFECVIFSVVTLIYFEQIAQNSGWLVELLGERDHRNEIHRLLSARLGAPLDPELDKAIDELKGQTEKAARRHGKHNLARLPIVFIVLWNLCRAVFFWPGA
jgi:hypothetical protein